MKFTRWIVWMAVPLAVLLAGSGPSLCPAQTTLISQLATWDTAPTGSVFTGGDFDPTLDTTATCSGCWYGKATGSGITYSYSTEHTTQGTGALKAIITGKGSGGPYTVDYNCTGPDGGPPCSSQELDTHFDDPLQGTYSNNPAANGGVLDARFTALNDAVNSGEQALYTIEFDIIYDVASMRAIPWMMPEETVNPGAMNENRYPQRYFWTGSKGQAFDSFQWVGFDANNVTPFDAQYDANLFPVFHASFPLDAFGFIPDASPDQHTYRQIAFLYNSTFGTLPASSNTSSVTVYFDNLQLRKIDPITPIDFNNNGAADPADWELFMAQMLITDPPAPALNPDISFDLVGDFGAATLNDVVDFHDLQKFQEYYTLASPGSAAILFGGVPEPGTIALAALALVGLIGSRARRSSRMLAPLVAVAALLVVGQRAAQAQLVETWSVLAPWQAFDNAAPGANPSVALSTIGATQGANSFHVTQAQDTTGDNDFSWNAATSPNYSGTDPAFVALANAVNVGAEHYNLLVDVTFDPDDTFNQGVNTLTVTLGLNFNGQTIGVYAGESERFTTTATIPLANFNLEDVEDEGATSYSAQIGFTADADIDPFGAYIDNIRLEQISQPDLLTLEIDRSNGAATLKNLTSNPISWDYMHIKSPGGSLDAAGWSSLDDQNADGAGTWIEAGGSSPTELLEASLLGSHELGAGLSMSLGNLYNEGINAEDIDLEIRRAAGPSGRTYDQLVTYIGVAPAGPIGDYNNDGTVNAADYTFWRDNQGGPGAVLGDNRDPANGAGPVAIADYNSWKAHFGESGAGSGGLAGAAAVPEPSSIVMGLCCVLAPWACRQSRARLVSGGLAD